jgi:hypothetical protein
MLEQDWKPKEQKQAKNFRKSCKRYMAVNLQKNGVSKKNPQF